MADSDGRNEKEVPIFATGTSFSNQSFRTTRINNRFPELLRTA
jgi:hypothetical protein